MATDKTSDRKMPPNAGKGKKPGTPNRTTKVLKEAILLAAEQYGENGKGKDGLTGYLRRLAGREPKSFATLLGKVLPTQLTGPNDGPVAVVYGDVNSLSDEDLMEIAQGRAPKTKNAKPDA